MINLLFLILVFTFANPFIKVSWSFTFTNLPTVPIKNVLLSIFKFLYQESFVFLSRSLVIFGTSTPLYITTLLILDTNFFCQLMSESLVFLELQIIKSQKGSDKPISIFCILE